MPGLGFALNLLGVWSKIRELLAAALDFALRHPWQTALAISLAYNGWQHHDRATLWRAVADYKRAIVAMKSAEADGRRAQIAANHVPAAISHTIAEQADAQAPDYFRRLATAAADHSVQPAGHCPIQPGSSVPGADRAGPGLHGPDPAAGVVCRPAGEDAQLVYAAGRAARMHQEALELIERGVAVPVKADPQP